MRKPILALASAVMLSAAAAAQQPSPPQQTASPSPSPQTASPSPPASTSPAAQSVRVRKGTLLKLETLQALDPATARPGDDVPLRFRRALYVEGVTLIPQGSLLHGTITKATPAGPHCNLGEVVWQLNELTLPDSSTVKTKIRFKVPGKDYPVAENTRTRIPTSAQEKAGKVIESGLVLPLAPLVFASKGIKSLGGKPHGCPAASPNKPLPAHSTVAVEILENHAVRY